VWWLRLGIGIERIKPGNPQQNGRHERMHLTLKKEATKPAAKNFLQQQAKFDDFIEGYNNDRPHQALNMKYPGEIYTPSPRPYKGLGEVKYPFHGRLRVVFYAKKQVATTPTESVKNDVVPWRVSTRASTLLDLLRHQTAVGGLETVARVTRDLSSAIDRGALVTALEALDQAPAGQRLGFVFQCLGYDALANHVFKWVARRRHAVRQPLELGVPTREQTTIDRRWNISFNSDRVTVLGESR
jgi:predicted transcriptional regulator of viral defense system